MFRVKKIFIFILTVSLIFPFELNKTEAATTTLSKTVEFFIGQDDTIRTDGNQISFSFANVIIPETAPVIKSAVVEINGVSYNSLGDQKINVDLEKSGDIVKPGTDYFLAQNAKPKSFSLKYNAIGTIDPAFSSYDLYLTGTSDAGTRSFSIFSAKLVLTYQYSASSSEVLKTTKFFIEQKTNQIASESIVSKPFTVSIPEKSSPENMPLIRSVFVEISGIAKGNSAGTIEAKVAKTGFDPVYSPYNLDLASSACGAPCPVPFLVHYDASSVISDLDFTGGSKDYTFYFKGTGFDTSVLSAKIIITYKYSEGASGLPVSGYVISSTVDTGITKGAAYNSLMWKGALNGGKVRLQLATSNSDVGPWSDSDFKGPNCTSGTFYEPAANTPIEVNPSCASTHNNKRYFRYKAILCSNDCVSSGSNNPQVNDVIVNWSP